MNSIRNLNLNNAEACFKIWSELPEHYDHPVGGQWTLLKIQNELKDHHGWGSFDEQGKLISFCLYRQIEPTRREIMLLATKSQEHRSGAMRALIRSLIADLNEDEGIWLEVHAGNLPAIGLYESLGFVLCGERKDYYADGGKALLFEYKSLS